MNLIRGLNCLTRFSNLFCSHENALINHWGSRLCSSSAFSRVDAPPPAMVQMNQSNVSPRVQKISKAMKAYLERAQAHEDFICEKNADFEIGKRHLANMMGLDYDNMTQRDINRAIEYLMPSGLYEKKARPMMKPPEELYPKEKAAQFEASGRPFSCFFYTRKSNLYETMHEIAGKFIELDEFQDKMLRRGIDNPPEESSLHLGGSAWYDYDEIKELFLEKITESQYRYFIETLSHLCAHMYAFRCKEFIFKFRKLFSDTGDQDSIPELIQDEGGRLYVIAEARRKSSNATVTVWGNGDGKVNINGRDIRYFYSMQDREQVMYPLQFTGLLGQVDIEARVEGSGHSAQAGAIRHGLSLCLRSFVPPDEVERLRLAGLLTADRRRKERKKPGQKGARAKYKWLKR